MEALLDIAGMGGAAYGTAVLINKNPAFAELLSKIGSIVFLVFVFFIIVSFSLIKSSK